MAARPSLRNANKETTPEYNINIISKNNGKTSKTVTKTKETTRFSPIVPKKQITKILSTELSLPKPTTEMNIDTETEEIIHAPTDPRPEAQEEDNSNPLDQNETGT